ncbi:Conserved oligomeric Golgi complex subunit 6 [Armadillidium nasatum]|uniref:Conserved oligomeric Golgi complex subunit 6 n=1 Tax=Armadillidium nasatum TaxID=96803 RepID=A0A5N5SR19_9CRUS|nr:Conserved oligomeric Golgi complex subunit 6 [Armadillidium nasatum]
MQEEVVKTFLKNFQLSSEEMFALKGSSRDSPITSQFFEALNKTQIIRNNTKYLLQTGHQKTALDIMEQMNVARESALERLFRWFQAQTRTPDPSPLIPEALAALQERPVLFKMVIEEWIVVRRGWLTRGFLDALTLGGPGGAPKPIELQAHDPLRYVGDMLAWIHQALPSEREAAQLLFSKCVDIDASEQVQQTISGVSESVCRPLKTRIEQVIVSEQGKGDPVGGKKAVHLYKISSLLHFYMSTIKQVTGKGLLVSTLEELHQLSYKMFISSLQNQVTHACDRVEPPGETLAPSAGVAKTLSLLTEIVTAATVSDDAHQDFKQIISCVVDPLLNAISESGASLGAFEGAVYLLNCLHQLHSTLSLLHTSSDKLEMIQGQIDAQLDTLSQEQINGVFHALGLSSIYPVIIPSPPVPLSSHPSCQPLAIQAFSTKLDGFLAAPDYLMFPHTRYLLSSSFRKQLHQRTAHAIISTYAQLHNLVHKPENEYSDPSSLMPKLPDVVKSLLL